MKTILTLFALSFVLAGCIKNNPDPAWIEVSAWQLQANPDAQTPAGILTHNISNAWVYVDNKVIGVFEVPFKIPVLAEGTSEIKLYPAIHNNGISSTKKIYPFLEPYVITATLEQNEVLTVNPVTRYFENVDFWIEDFEDNTFKIDDGNSSLASIERISGSDPVKDPAINDGSFGRIILDETDHTWLGTTIANNAGVLAMNLPKGKEVYLEIDYHNTTNLTTGVIAIENNGTGGTVSTDNINVRMNAQDESSVKWKKIYIDLRDIVSGSVNADYFEFSFHAKHEESGTREINIDNIKAVYF